MNSKVFEFQDYKSYLRARIEQSRGNLTSFAEAAGCQASYLSRVCSSKIQLTQDHAFRLSRFWGLDKGEREYFMNLVDFERAGDAGLRESLKQTLHQARARESNLQNKTHRQDSNSYQLNGVYHSHWSFAAVHFLTSIKSFTTAGEISERLQLPGELVSDVLKQLTDWNLIRSSGKRFFFQTGVGHIEKSSPVLPLFHANWRNKSVTDSQLRHTDGLHFTNIQTVSKKDFERLKQLASEFVETTTALATQSEPEELIVIICDVFKP